MINWIEVIYKNQNVLVHKDDVYIAVNVNGNAVSFNQEPVFNEDFGEWYCDSGCLRDVSGDFSNVNYSESLCLISELERIY